MKVSKDEFTEAFLNYDNLPNSAWVRLQTVKQLRGSSASTVWRDVIAKRLPAPRKLSPGVTAWNVGELRVAMQELTK